MVNNLSGMNRGSQKKLALINDFCGFGRCSLTVSIPIVSAMGIQACPVPTAVFSNHTAYESFYKHDMTAALGSYLNEWSKLNLKFDAILSGYLSSPEQIGITSEFAEKFLAEDGIFILDPVMGDNGRLYSAYSPDMLKLMKELLKNSDVITPNLTECCFLTDTPYETVKKLKGAALNECLSSMAQGLSSTMKNGHGSVVISGIESEHYIGNFVYDVSSANDIGNNTSANHKLIKMKKSGVSRCGTGDIFSAIISASLVRGGSLWDSVSLAAHFIQKCITVSDNYNIPLTDGVAFEDVLWMLTPHRAGKTVTQHNL